MAIARKIDPAALARSFADEISGLTEVKRVWYRYRPNTINPERMSLDFNIQFDYYTPTATMAISDALTRIQTEYFDELSVGTFEFTLAEDDVLTLDDLVDPEASELQLQRD